MIIKLSSSAGLTGVLEIKFFDLVNSGKKSNEHRAPQSFELDHLF